MTAKLHGRIRVAPELAAAIQRLLDAEDNFQNVTSEYIGALHSRGGFGPEHLHEQRYALRRQLSEARIDLQILLGGGRP
jgi:hypothetical protein